MMKNKLTKHSYPGLFDSSFDKNKDGKLSPLEKSFRDSFAQEVIRDTEEERSRPKDGFTAQKSPLQKAAKDNAKPDETENNTTSAGVQLFCILITNAVLVGGFILAISIDIPALIRVLILFAAVAVALGFLKFGGLYK